MQGQAKHQGFRLAGVGNGGYVIEQGRSGAKVVQPQCGQGKNDLFASIANGDAGASQAVVNAKHYGHACASLIQTHHGPGFFHGGCGEFARAGIAGIENFGYTAWSGLQSRAALMQRLQKSLEIA